MSFFDPSDPSPSEDDRVLRRIRLGARRPTRRTRFTVSEEQLIHLCEVYFEQRTRGGVGPGLAKDRILDAIERNGVSGALKVLKR